MIFEGFAKKHHEKFYFVFRVLVGLMFIQHGAQKLFGVLGFEAMPLFSLMGLAGVIEFFGGLAIAFGFLTRLVALGASLEMVTAYYIAHIPAGPFPILNGGEPAVLFFASFLVLFVYGAKKWSLERALFKKEIF